MQLIENDIHRNELICKLEMTACKRDTIMKLNSLLGLKNSNNTGVKITLEQMNSAINHIKSNISTIKSAFNSKIKDNAPGNASFIKLLRKIYSDWSGLLISNGTLDSNKQAKNYTSNTDIEIYDHIRVCGGRYEISNEDLIMFMSDDFEEEEE